MATKTVGKTTLTYSINSSDAQSTVVTVSLNVQVTLGRSLPAGRSYTGTISANGTVGSLSGSDSKTVTWRNTGSTTRTVYVTAVLTPISNKTISYTKGKSAVSKTLSFGSTTTEDSGSVSITVPAKPSYTVSYNVNGGTGSIASSTKWYGETLTLTTSKPVKSGYTFRGWATSTANAGTNTTTTTYTGNANATFYATWELNYSKPSITNLKVERCNVNGEADDEGTYARVTFNWSVFRSSAARYYGGSVKPYENNSATCSINVGGKSLTPTLSGASGSYSGVVGDGSYDADTQYAASVTITDTQTVQSAKTTTVNGILSKAAFPMDFNRDGTAVGILMPAPDNAEGVYISKNLSIMLDTTATSGTDKDIYDALVSLGWTDVIV